MTPAAPLLLAVDHAAALGVNRAVYRALAGLGFRVELVIARSLWHLPGDRPHEPAAPEDPPLRPLAFAGRNLRYVRVEGLSELVARLRPPLLYLNNEPDTPLAWRLARLQHRHGGRLAALSLESEFRPFWPALLRGRLRPAARHLRTRLSALATRGVVDHVFCHSRQIERTWRALGFAARSSIVPLGVDEQLFHPDAARRAATRRRLGLTQPTVAYVGRLAPQKGVDLLIEALGRLAARPWQLLLPARRPDNAYAAALAARIDALGLRGRVVEFDAPHAEVPDYQRAADIVVVPSRWEEQYGRVAAESLACGAAVIAARRGALPEIVGEAGLLVPSDDVPALAAALEGLLAAPERRAALGAAGAARARQALTVACQAEGMARVFRRLLADPAP